MALEQRAVRLLGEGPARGDVARLRHGERRVDGIDAAHEIDMLRRGGEGRELLAAEREEHAPRRFAERLYGVLDRGDLDPIVAGLLRSRAAACSASNGTPRHLGGASRHWRK